MPTRKYPIITKACPMCSAAFEASFGSPKEKQTCSYSCASSLKRHSEDTKNKIRAKLNELAIEKNSQLYTRKNPHYKNCKHCNVSFLCGKKTQAFCTRKCVISWRGTNPEYLKNLSIARQRLIKEGRHKGWASRDRVARSYPEQYTEQVLEKEFGIVKNRDYVPDQKCGKWFIDFAFNDRKLALEIDGKQHELPERKASDIEKDKFLVEQGWTVHRVKWKRIKTKEDRENFISIITAVLK